jgi:hypothetical protein
MDTFVRPGALHRRLPRRAVLRAQRAFTAQLPRIATGLGVHDVVRRRYQSSRPGVHPAEGFVGLTSTRIGLLFPLAAISARHR